MSDELNTTRRHHLTREEEADRSLNHTTYSPGSNILTALIFLAVVFGVPIAQHVIEIKQNLAKQAAWDPKSGEPKPGIAPKIYDVVSLLPTKQQVSDAKGFWGYWSLIPSMESIDKFEKDLKQESILTKAFLSPAQSVLTKVFDVGNEKAYCGVANWLFYRPDVEYLTSDGFLNPSRLRERRHSSAELQPDPVQAILDFKAQLAARKIQLVVMPMPTKPMIEPEELLGARGEHLALQNPSFGQFFQTLEDQGIPVYDATKLLQVQKEESEEPQYLETDTHWTPDAMEAVAYDLAAFIRSRCGTLPSVPNPGYKVQEKPVSNLGDIAEMLRLPADQKLYKPQSVVTHQVIQSDGSPWTEQPSADVLLLGDSFSNIFSLKGMNWGEASGLAEHLSYALGRPLDKFVNNGGGASDSRIALARAMKRSDRLAGKRVVVLEFSMRDLSQGDWKIIKLPAPPKMQTAPLVVPPPPVVATTVQPFKVVSVKPASIDPAKGDSSLVTFLAPAGSWTATIVDSTGKLVARLKSGKETATESNQVRWNGKADDGKAVPTGSYKVKITGTGVTGKPIEPLTANVAVIGPPTGEIEAIGANPEKIDAATKETTTVSFQIPVSGDYEISLLDNKGRTIRRFGKKHREAGDLDLEWNGTDALGKPVSDGTYRLQVKPRDGSTKLKSAEVSVVVASSKKATNTTVPPKPGPTKPNDASKPPVKPASDELVISGTVSDRAKDPVPGASAYKDCLIEIRLTNVKAVTGTLGNGDIAVYVWGMRDNKLVGGAYAKGASVTLKLVPWDKAGSVTSNAHLDLDNDDGLTIFWGVKK